MPIPHEVRPRLPLGLSGALLTILPWQAVALLVGTLTRECGVCTGRGQAPRRQPDAPRAGLPGATGTPLSTTRPAPARTRLPLAIVRRLGAECALCDGLGCGECAHSGLR